MIGWDRFWEKVRKKLKKPYRKIHNRVFYSRKKYERYISDILKEELRMIRKMGRDD